MLIRCDSGPVTMFVIGIELYLLAEWKYATYVVFDLGHSKYLFVHCRTSVPMLHEGPLQSLGMMGYCVGRYGTAGEKMVRQYVG